MWRVSGEPMRKKRYCCVWNGVEHVHPSRGLSSPPNRSGSHRTGYGPSCRNKIWCQCRTPPRAPLRSSPFASLWSILVITVQFVYLWSITRRRDIHTNSCCRIIKTVLTTMSVHAYRMRVINGMWVSMIRVIMTKARPAKELKALIQPRIYRGNVQESFRWPRSEGWHRPFRPVH